MIELDKFKHPRTKEVLTNHFAFELMRYVPWHVEKFFEQ